jgi:hypothetical protein
VAKQYLSKPSIISVVAPPAGGKKAPEATR